MLLEGFPELHGASRCCCLWPHSSTVELKGADKAVWTTCAQSSVTDACSLCLRGGILQG